MDCAMFDFLKVIHFHPHYHFLTYIYSITIYFIPSLYLFHSFTTSFHNYISY